MKQINCEDVLMAQMAAMDGEASRLSQELIATHIAGCANCHAELEQLKALDQMLAGHTLSEPRVDFWPAIENRIPTRVGWQPFAAIGALLIAYKLLELLPAHDLGLAFKLVPLIIVPLLFLLIKENPFRINPELIQER